MADEVVEFLFQETPSGDVFVTMPDDEALLVEPDAEDIYQRERVLAGKLAPSVAREVVAQLKGVQAAPGFAGSQPEGSSGVGSTEAEAITARAARRQTVVNPILDRKRWMRGRLATEAGLGKNSVYKYLDGTRDKITTENRKALADALGLGEDQLPD